MLFFRFSVDQPSWHLQVTTSISKSLLGDTMAAQNQTSYPNDSMPSDVSDASDDLGEGAFALGSQARQATESILAAISTAP